MILRADAQILTKKAGPMSGQTNAEYQQSKLPLHRLTQLPPIKYSTELDATSDVKPAQHYCSLADKTWRLSGPLLYQPPLKAHQPLISSPPKALSRTEELNRSPAVSLDQELIHSVIEIKKDSQIEAEVCISAKEYQETK